jgi:hypothetical protein
MPRSLPDCTGQRYGRLIAVRRGPDSKAGHVRYYCDCDCGTKDHLVTASGLRNGQKSCGCLGSRNAIGARSLRHGATIERKFTPEYSTWRSMKMRCHSPTYRQFHKYGGRGIQVCSRWRDSFEAFLEDMGPRPAGTSIDRIDGSRGYEPRNCRWATAKIQGINKRSVVLYEHQGVRLHLKDWASRVGIKYQTLRARVLRLGWSLEKALTTPVQ